MNKAYLCVITKNEGRDLAEWILYHLFLGFHKIIIYDNASTDNTYELVTLCHEYGHIEYIYWPKPFSQIKAYENCINKFGRECDWMAFLDVDEFLVLPRHKYFEPFLQSVMDSKAVAIHWRMFGSNNQKFISNSLVLKTFLRRAIDEFSANRHIKTIVKTKYVNRVINPHFFQLKRKKWYTLDRFRYNNAAGKEINWLKPGKAKDHGDASIAIIHHYFTKSEEHYAKKLERGNADKKIERKNAFEFNNKNDVYDDSVVQIYSEELKKIEYITSNL